MMVKKVSRVQLYRESKIIIITRLLYNILIMYFIYLRLREFQYTGSSFPFQETTRFLPSSRIYSDHFDRGTKLG